MRDTQFAEFANLLFEQMKPDLAMLIVDVGRKDASAIESTQDLLRLTIARRAYDFACHVSSHVSERDAAEMDAQMKTLPEVVNEMPDMRQWPEETSK